tara:strand:+ start:748 stop:1239 length:492 start_codon:yes stop_codon:yes gene_type:complete
MATTNNRKVYKFKSVGELESETRTNDESVANSVKLPIGIATPVSLGNNSLLKMHTSTLDVINDNFRNMLMTNHGDRLGFYDFGANLEELTFELGSENGDAEATRRIAKTTAKYMPFINLDTFEPFVEKFDNQHTAKVGIRVTYNVPRITTDMRAIEVLLYVAG